MKEWNPDDTYEPARFWLCLINIAALYLFLIIVALLMWSVR